MTVHPGFGGQTLIKSCLKKVAKLEKKSPMLDIAVDGGISKSNIHEALLAGASIIVTGSAIFRSRNPAKAIREMKECAEFRC
jgi:ribulose-phosphate 3-epimerase